MNNKSETLEAKKGMILSIISQAQAIFFHNDYCKKLNKEEENLQPKKKEENKQERIFLRKVEN